jgi:putative MATE family efflux protein
MILDEEALPEPARQENSARIVWTLAWPAVALNSLQVINTLLDRWFTGTLTASALAGYSGAIVMNFLMFSIAMAVATGATALVSRAFGAGERATWRISAQQALSISVVAGVTAALFQTLVSHPFADLILPPGDPLAKSEMSAYLLNYALGIPAIFLIQTLAGSLRGVGDTKSPMFISGIQIGLHICLNMLLIFPPQTVNGVHLPGLGLGLKGASLALSTSAWISAVGYLAYIPRTRLGPLNLFKPPRFDWAMRIIRIALPAGVMSTLRVFSLTIFSLVLKQVPNASASLAGMSIAFAIESIMFMPSFGLSAAAAALVGQSLGMKRPDRAERLAWTAGHHGAMVTICLAIPIYLLAPNIANGITHGKQDISDAGTLLIRFLCISEFLFAYAMILIGAMQGAGDTVRPLWITVLCMWVIRVPLAAILALPHGFRLAGLVPLPLAAGLGTYGAWLAMSSSQAVQGVLAMLAFKQGRWKTEKV